MTDPAVGSYSFLPWVRQGAASVLSAGGPARARAVMPVTIRYNDATDVDVTVKLHGPGDVVGIDTRQVVRTDPPHLGRDAETNYFPCVEFDRPELPWLFTPLAPDVRNRLQPWICLVVVREQDGVRIVSSPDVPASVLTIGAPAVPADELPDLAEAWAWAHAQVSGSVSTGDSLDEVLAQHPARTISRLMAPRRLEPRTTYLACVVPTFAVGVKAGLGQQVTAADENRLDPAWPSPPLARVDLPVYYHWEFTTGDEGDFESLVRRLQPREMPDRVGIRNMDISTPGMGMPVVAGAVLGMEGALRALSTRSTPWADRPRNAFRAGLRTRLDVRPGPAGPVVSIPLYGRWHAAVTEVPADADPPPWLRELNLDPRTRAAAGLGTRIVQQHQEDLMASAWEQVGEVDRANRLLLAAQLARAVNGVMAEKRLAQLDAARLLQLAAPALGRLPTADRDEPTTVLAKVQDSTLPDAVVTPAFRKVARPLGPLAKRAVATPTDFGSTLVQRLATGALDVATTAALPPGIVTFEASSAARPTATVDVRFEHLSANALAAVDPTRVVDAPPVFRRRRGRSGVAFKDAAVAHQAVLEAALADSDAPAPPPALSLVDARVATLQALDPKVTVPAATLARLDLTGIRRPADPLDVIMAAPEFPQPMYEPLRDLSQDLLLPGLELVPVDTIGLLRTNPSFIESYMVGLNHEMARELLWREYPTDQRGSCFRQFWDVGGRVPTPSTAAEREAAKDIGPIHLWSRTAALGENLRGEPPGGRLVLLVRGALLQRYPSAVIYAAEARWDSSRRVPTDNERHPVFRGTLPPDVTFLGFDLTPAQANGSRNRTQHPGWFFVIQQRPGEPRFGLDVTDDPARSRISSWSQLSWGHVTADPYVRLTDALPDTSGVTSPPGVAWGATSSETAFVTLQQPVRIAVHASAMLPETT